METATVLPTEKATPSVPRGVAVIAFWIGKIDRWLLTNPTLRTFQMVFRQDGDHLFGKDWREDFGGFFLNLDNKNQIRLLAFLRGLEIEEINLDLPEIPDWRKHGANFGMDKWPMYDQEDVRSLVVSFGKMTDWEAYPHDLVWLRKFMLYALNHGIDDEDYTGEGFGNYTNWAAYYNWLSVHGRLVLCKTLVDYN